MNFSSSSEITVTALPGRFSGLEHTLALACICWAIRYNLF